MSALKDELLSILSKSTNAETSQSKMDRVFMIILLLTHSSAHWILDSGASNHISDNKDLFSSLTFPFPLPTISLSNGSQTIAKGMGSACPLPSLPLTSVLYVSDLPYNLISISKLTRDLHCMLTFSHNFVTL